MNDRMDHELLNTSDRNWSWLSSVAETTWANLTQAIGDHW